MSFPYKTVLVIGATSGIGLALAEKCIAIGSHVIAVGRRKENLNDLVQKYGNNKVTIFQFDITNLQGIPDFVKSYASDTLLLHLRTYFTNFPISRVTAAHTKLDSVILNSGIQRGFDFTKPETVDLNMLDLEVTTNYLSHIHLFTHLLPHLQSLAPTLTALIFVTSGLALVPFPRYPNYCATKAAMHHLILSLREQLSGSNVKVVEILPPAVQTELHDEKHQPDIKGGGRVGIPIGEFTEEAWKGLCEGSEGVPVGIIKGHYEGWERERQEGFKMLVRMMKQSGQ
ncbi:putative short-chain dehydrogenase [Venustampulla echinocandica]|uniref:Putative short-chain dehydrogenase n=1 Tax=Venustampulla echinocandica TaxID=2656787 RepID=A0A370TUB4_9HELO|nr:putative short-chain dehydrogenase [Venustampulla echinocandica]RDL39122.1 putative short-chain dehydrogenase [Venustampulla echinocandica]